VVLFHKAAVQASCRERASSVIDMAVAYHAKQQDRTKYIKSLDKNAK
jgi:hypothetical protein